MEEEKERASLGARRKSPRQKKDPKNNEGSAKKKDSKSNEEIQEKTQAEVVQSLDKYTKWQYRVDVHPSQLQNFMYRDEQDKLYTMDVNASSIRPPLLAKNANGMLGNILKLKNTQVSDMQTFDSDRPRIFAVRLKVSER